MKKTDISVQQIISRNLEGTQKVAKAINESAGESFDGRPLIDMVISTTAALLVNVKSAYDSVGHTELFNDYLDNHLPVIIAFFKDNVNKISKD